MWEGSYHVNEEPEGPAPAPVMLALAQAQPGTQRQGWASGLPQPSAQLRYPVSALPRVQTHPGSKSWVVGSSWLPRFLNELGYLSSSLWTKGLGLRQNLPRCGSSPPHGIRE